MRQRKAFLREDHVETGDTEAGAWLTSCPLEGGSGKVVQGEEEGVQRGLSMVYKHRDAQTRGTDRDAQTGGTELA